MTTTAPLLRVSDLTKQYGTRRRGSPVNAVDGVSLDIAPGEAVGLVGESGCGKSTMAAMVMGLTRPTAGTVEFDGRTISGLSARQLRTTRRDLQIVFQDPYSSLDRRMRVFDTVAEPLRVHRLASGEALRERVQQLLTMVGLSSHHADRYPSQLSGGQRQRVGIARALALEPKLLVLDEPVSALDVSVQAQVLNLLQRLRRELGLAYLFISHDLSVVAHLCDRVAVMYLGRVVEVAESDVLFAAARHPYTQALLSAVPSDDPFRRSLGSRIRLGGELPDPHDVPPGCSFHPRCPRVGDRCRAEPPELRRRTAAPHPVACHFPGEETR